MRTWRSALQRTWRSALQRTWRSALRRTWRSALRWRRSAVAALLAVCAAPAMAQDVRLPVLVPLTGFVALEGTSQRNGALLAASQIRDVVLRPDVLDTQATPEAAVTAWERV